MLLRACHILSKPVTKFFTSAKLTAEEKDEQKQGLLTAPVNAGTPAAPSDGLPAQSPA